MLWNVSEWEAHTFKIDNLTIPPHPPTQDKTEAKFLNAKVMKD